MRFTILFTLSLVICLQSVVSTKHNCIADIKKLVSDADLYDVGETIKSNYTQSVALNIIKDYGKRISYLCYVGNNPPKTIYILKDNWTLVSQISTGIWSVSYLINPGYKDLIFQYAAGTEYCMTGNSSYPIDDDVLCRDKIMFYIGCTSDNILCVPNIYNISVYQPHETCGYGIKYKARHPYMDNVYYTCDNNILNTYICNSRIINSTLCEQVYTGLTYDKTLNKMVSRLPFGIKTPTLLYSWSCPPKDQTRSVTDLFGSYAIVDSYQSSYSKLPVDNMCPIIKSCPCNNKFDDLERRLDSMESTKKDDQKEIIKALHVNYNLLSALYNDSEKYVSRREIVQVKQILDQLHNVDLNPIMKMMHLLNTRIDNVNDYLYLDDVRDKAEIKRNFERVLLKLSNINNSMIIDHVGIHAHLDSLQLLFAGLHNLTDTNRKTILAGLSKTKTEFDLQYASVLNHLTNMSIENSLEDIEILQAMNDLSRVITNTSAMDRDIVVDYLKTLEVYIVNNLTTGFLTNHIQNSTTALTKLLDLYKRLLSSGNTANAELNLSIAGLNTEITKKMEAIKNNINTNLKSTQGSVNIKVEQAINSMELGLYKLERRMRHDADADNLFQLSVVSLIPDCNVNTSLITYFDSLYVPDVSNPRFKTIHNKYDITELPLYNITSRYKHPILSSRDILIVYNVTEKDFKQLQMHLNQYGSTVNIVHPKEKTIKLQDASFRMYSQSAAIQTTGLTRVYKYTST